MKLSHGSFIVLFAGVVLGMGCVDDAQPQAEVEQTIHALTAGASPVEQERRSVSGKFPEVMNSPGCTGTILGPYAVITARHCGGNGTIRWPDSSITRSIQTSLTNPYADAPYFPAWWRALNQEQIDLGIRLNDWPAQHDNRILFVPSLDEQTLASLLNNFDVMPQVVDPYATGNRRYVVGMSNPTRREYARVNGFSPVTSNPPINSIACHNVNPFGQCVRDGYFRVDNSVTADPGDSGGPTLGALEVQRNGRTVTGPRHIIGTTQNTQIDMAPLSYDNNLTLTVNQRLTVRLNQLWVKAAVSDADQDNLPYECDNDPSSSSNPVNLCMAPLGKMDTPTEPRALLQCKDGYGVTGLRGRQGWLIDRLAVRCTPLSCLEQNSSTCTTSQSYWTDHFGGETNGGVPFDKTCPTGKVLTHLAGRQTPNSLVHEIRTYCKSYKAHVLDHVSTGYYGLGTIGNSGGSRSDGSNVPLASCPDYGYFKGFEVRSKTTGVNTMNFITGLQPICSGKTQHSTFIGSYGGSVHDHQCPVDYVAVGISARPNIYNDLGTFALLCMKRSNVESYQSAHDTQLVAVYGSGYDAQGFYPSHQKSFLSFKTEHNTLTTQKCPAGKTLRGATFRQNTLLKQLKSIQCEDHRPTVYSSIDYSLNLGAAVGTLTGTYCGINQHVRGMLIHSGWAVDGLSFYCEDQQ